MELLVCGDFCPQLKVHDMIIQKHYDEIFGDTIQLIKKADFSIINLECPAVDNDKWKGIHKAGPLLKGSPKMIEALKHVGFNIATLANNHIFDYGNPGVLLTIRTLKENRLLYVGAGENLNKAQSPLIIEHKGYKLGIINICETEFSIASDNTAGANPIDLITLYNQIPQLKLQVDYLLLIVHGGHEHYQLPSPRMKKLYHHLVDLGVDTIVNHHQHCFSGYEEYKGKFIFYGLGNFNFNKPSKKRSMWNEGYMLRIVIDNHKFNFELCPYIQCDSQPITRLMNKEEKELFFRKIKELNNIIANDELLKEEFDKWIKDNKKRYQSYLSPYSSRYIRYLCRLGFLPNNLTRNRKNVLYDMFMCESHRDVIIEMLKYEC